MKPRAIRALALALILMMLLPGCQAVRKWRAKGDASSAERLRELEKQMETLTAHLEEVDLELRFNVASNQVSLGKYERAIEWFREIVRRNPNAKYAADSLYEIANIYKYNLKDAGKAVAAYEDLVKRYPKSEFVKNASYEIAESLSELGNKIEALVRYRGIILKFGKDRVSEKAHFDMGEIYQEDKKYEQARDAYEKLIKTFPAGENRPAAFYRMAVCSLALSDTVAALDQYKSVIQDFPASEFSELAMFGRISVLMAQNSHGPAGDEISQYMIRYPNGRFRAEAERFLSKINNKKPAAP
ncbi:tetratricopeptide repeat protein [bacterium]|nr:tetratricopeptide repeat protein [bacterium]